MDLDHLVNKVERAFGAWSRSVFNLTRLLLFSVVDKLAIKSPPKKVPHSLLLIRLDAIGDYILFRNFIELLKKTPKFSKYKITLCGNEVLKNLAEVYDSEFIEDFIWIRIDEFLRNVIYRAMILRKISQFGFEVAIQPTYSRLFFVGDALVRASYAEHRIGSEGDLHNMAPWQKNISDRYYTQLIQAGENYMFEFYRNREFFENLLDTQIDLKGPELTMRNSESKRSTKNRFAILFIGGANRYRRWNQRYFADVAMHIINKYNLDIIIAGSANEQRSSKRLFSIIEQKTKCIDLTGKTTLSEIVKLISSADLLVSNDTSAVHIAAAVKTKGVCISNGFHFGRFSPYPADVNNKIFYVYPQTIMEEMEKYKFSHITSRYYKSDLPINAISPEDVKKRIDICMKTESSNPLRY